jgi:hypothetical protein
VKEPEEHPVFCSHLFTPSTSITDQATAFNMVQPFHAGGAANAPLLSHGPIRGIHLIRYLCQMAFNDHRVDHALSIWKLGASVIPFSLDLFYSLRHCVRLFFTSSVTIKSTDELYVQVFNWLAKRDSQRWFIREYTAQTLKDGSSRTRSSTRGGMPYSYSSQHVGGDEAKGSSRIKYKPTFKTTWFFYANNLLASTT